MLFQQSIDKLNRMRLNAMARFLDEVRANPEFQALGAEDIISGAVDAQEQEDENRRFARLLKAAKLKVDAVPEDINYKANRNLDRRVVAALLTCDWIKQQQNLIITGLTGTGKTWLGCSFGHQACRKDLRVLYVKLSRLLEAIEIARGDGSLPRLRMQLAKLRLLILDDWGLAPLTPKGRHDLLDLVDDRAGSSSLLITSQFPVNKWHDWVGEPTLADAILDRLAHSAHRIELSGDSLRKVRGKRSGGAS